MLAQLVVQLPTEVAAELDAEAGVDLAVVLHPGPSLGGLAEVARFSAVFAAQPSTLAILALTPEVFQALGASIARQGLCTNAYWFNIKGPGGQATLSLAEPLDGTVLADLLTACWTRPDDHR